MDAKTLALYLGCEIFVYDKDARERYTAKLDTVCQDGTSVVEDTNGTMLPVRPERIKLLLRPLSSMTDEDAYQIENEMRKISPSFKFNGGSHFDNVELFEMSSLLNLLRSKSFDCDGLIEKGEAIDATKLAS